MIDHRPGVRILVVDDERGARLALEVPLRLSGYDVTSVARGHDAIALLAGRSFDIVLTDIYMPDLNGLEVIRAVRKLSPETRIIAVTAQGSLEIAMTAIREGAFDFIAKPYNIDDMLALVRRATAHATAKPAADPTATADFSPSGLIGHSPEMVKAYKLTAHAARTSATVLIEGESGTGKELVARALHDESPRRNRPFVALNCSALPSELLEAEFFGARKGSYTGATHDREGFFQAARGGTLFLDEIGDLPLAMQSKLLRAI